MKTVIVLLATVFSFSAHALESHYGKLSYSKGQYHCTLTNNGGAKNLKYVVFNLERRAGKDNRDYSAQIKIDTVVAAGETITAHSGISMAVIGQSCKFLAR
jgi:hypothetical protein